MHVYLIRHGRQASKDCGADVPLDDAGREQARLLGLRMTGSAGEAVPVRRIYTSPLLRARETAEILTRATEVPCLVRDSLSEIDYGELTGLDYQTRFTRYAGFYRERARSGEDIPYPGGENLADVWQRVRPFFEEITAREGDIAVVTHLETIRAILGGTLGFPFAACRHFTGKLEHTSLTDLSYSEKDGTWQLTAYNDAVHLLSRPELRIRAWRE